MESLKRVKLMHATDMAVNLSGTLLYCQRRERLRVCYGSIVFPLFPPLNERDFVPFVDIIDDSICWKMMTMQQSCRVIFSKKSNLWYCCTHCNNLLSLRVDVSAFLASNLGSPRAQTYLSSILYINFICYADLGFNFEQAKNQTYPGTNKTGPGRSSNWFTAYNRETNWWRLLS